MTAEPAKGMNPATTTTKSNTFQGSKKYLHGFFPSAKTCEGWDHVCDVMPRQLRVGGEEGGMWVEWDVVVIIKP